MVGAELSVQEGCWSDVLPSVPDNESVKWMEEGMECFANLPKRKLEEKEAGEQEKMDV